MQYMLLIYGNEQTWAGLAPEKMQASFTAYMEYSRKLVESGAMRAAGQLQPSGSASTVRYSESGGVVHDGPFAETKEHLGGYYIVEAANLDEALEWAKACPAGMHGASVEVRPLVPSNPELRA